MIDTKLFALVVIVWCGSAAVGAERKDDEFLKASYVGDFEAVKSHVEETDCDLNRHISGSGWQTSLMLASAGGNKEIVSYLLERGADPNQKDETGSNAMRFALGEEHDDVVRALVEGGARLDGIVASDFTLLGDAIGTVTPGMIRLLLELGADPNLLDPTEMSPLVLAIQKGLIVDVQLLLKFDADVNLPTKENFTALHYAVTGGHYFIASILMENCADPLFWFR